MGVVGRLDVLPRRVPLVVGGVLQAEVWPPGAAPGSVGVLVAKGEATMSIYEQHRYSILCDGKNCYGESTPSESESTAIGWACEDGWEEIGGKWYCEKCKGKAKRAERRRTKTKEPRR